jgi:hypothetical protein
MLPPDLGNLQLLMALLSHRMYIKIIRGSIYTFRRRE